MAQQTFKLGAARIDEIVKSCVGLHHDDLATVHFVSVETNKASEAVRVVRGSPYDRAMGIDLIVVYQEAVLALADDQITALIDHALTYFEGVEKEGRKGAPPRHALQRRQPTKVHLTVLERHRAIVGTVAEWRRVAETGKKLDLPLLRIIADNANAAAPADAGPADTSSPANPADADIPARSTRRRPRSVDLGAAGAGGPESTAAAQ